MSLESGSVNVVNRATPVLVTSGSDGSIPIAEYQASALSRSVTQMNTVSTWSAIGHNL